MIENHMVRPYADDDAREEPYDSGYNEIEKCDLDLQTEVDRLLGLNSALDDLAFTAGGLKRDFDAETRRLNELAKFNSGSNFYAARRDDGGEE